MENEFLFHRYKLKVQDIWNGFLCFSFSVNINIVGYKYKQRYNYYKYEAYDRYEAICHKISVSLINRCVCATFCCESMRNWERASITVQHLDIYDNRPIHCRSIVGYSYCLNLSMDLDLCSRHNL